MYDDSANSSTILEVTCALRITIAMYVVVLMQDEKMMPSGGT